MQRKVALVTGGTGGIGTAICRELAQQGCRVVAGYVPSDREVAESWRETQRTLGHDVGVVAGDVTSFESSGEMVREVEANVGPIDILVNCAGITRDKTLRKMEKDQWDAVINTNLNSAFNVTRQVIEGMVTRGYGRIVNISSVNGQRGQFGQTNYSAAKAGIHGFTMALAQEVASRGVTVNTVSPGYVATSMALAVPEEIRKQIVAQIPLGRLATPEEIAFTVGFLVDTRCAYVTGANIAVNGGLYMS
ncbi:MAG: acetoacetyl-CoA reductase [Gammaproteobacteria bacterium]|nr:acetoacetyl-CoA reductase [Gammaproteobacteria bacterium]